MSELSKQYFVQLSERSIWRVVKFFGFTLLLAVVIVGLVYLQELMLPIVMSIFLSYLLEPAVDAMENHGMNRTIAVSVLFVAIIGALVLVVVLLSDTVSTEMQHMLSDASV